MSDKPKIIANIKNLANALEMNNTLQQMYINTDALRWKSAKEAAEKIIEANNLAIELSKSMVEYLRMINPDI